MKYQQNLARLLVGLVPVGDGPWRLTLDRTHWRFGQVDINFLVLGIAYRGIVVPVLWNVLDKAGNSNTSVRIALMERFLAVFGVCPAGRPQIRRRGVVPLATNATDSVPSTD